MGNKQKQLRSLTWKYFWEQKLEEAGKPILIGLLILVIPLIPLIPLLFTDIQATNELGTIGNFFYNYLISFMACAIVFVFLLAIYSIIEGLIKWIKSNWKKARRRAKHQVYNKSKRRKK